MVYRGEYESTLENPMLALEVAAEIGQIQCKTRTENPVLLLFLFKSNVFKEERKFFFYD